MLFGLSIAAAFPVAWYFLRNDQGLADKPVKAAKRIAPQAKAAHKARRRNFKGASIKPGNECCQAVRDLGDKRYLVEAAPRLPLESCDRVAECDCTYHNHPDRRAGVDRRNLFGSMSTSGEIGSQGSNIRSGMDRRSSSEQEFEGIEFENDIENY